ncbi:MAG: UbiA prenyltransferase family protein [Planctomycetota bacterium]
MIAFTSFCLVASAGYIINDLLDSTADRQHPTKKYRPIASKKLNRNESIILSTSLLLLSLVVAFLIDIGFVTTIMAYAVLSMLYSFWLKNIVILDVLTISMGFVLRVLGGGFAVQLNPSPWLLLCTLTFICFLGFTKRRAEIIFSKSVYGKARPAIRNYNALILNPLIHVSAATTIIYYSLYIFDITNIYDTRTAVVFGTFLSVVFGIYRYNYKSCQAGQGEDPVRMIASDVPMVINLGLWLMLSILMLTYQ